MRVLRLGEKENGFSRLQGFKMRSCMGYGSSWVILIGIIRGLDGGTNAPQFWAPGNFELFVLAERAPNSTPPLLFHAPALTGDVRIRWSTFYDPFCKECRHGPTITCELVSCILPYSSSLMYAHRTTLGMRFCTKTIGCSFTVVQNNRT